MNKKSLLLFVKTLLLFTILFLPGVPTLIPNAAAQQEAMVSPAKSPSSESVDPYFKKMYRDFYDTYRLGPDDQLSVRVFGQPDYSLEKVKISPVGRIYHPLLGDVEVAGLTVDRLTEKLTVDLSQYIIDPKVSISLIEANSAKIGVLGDVVHPGIVVMTRPMNVLEAITASGGFAETGSRSDVTVLRQ